MRIAKGSLVSVAVSLALAGKVGAAEEVAGTEGSGLALTEIVVSAQRRDESVNKVPISMTALSQAALDDLHVENLSDLASIAPGLMLPHPSATNNSTPDIAIRGVFSGGNQPTTQLYIDETAVAIRQMRSAALSGTFFPDVVDLQRVEVLRGPQGTLFGASAMGGAIRFITAPPNLQDSSGFVKTEWSATQRGDPSYSVGGAYGSAIVPGTLGFRVSGSYRMEGGYVDSASPFTGERVARNTNDSQAYSLRGALTYIPVEGLTITPAIHFQKQEADDIAAYWVRPALGFHTGGDAPSEPSDDRLIIPSLTIKYELPGMVLQSDSSYLDRKFHSADDNTWVIETVRGGSIMIPGVPPSFMIRKDQLGGTVAWQQQLRLTSATDSPLQWILGAYFRTARERIAQPITPNLDPLTLAIFGKTSLQQFGIPDYVLNGVALNQYNNFHTTDEETSLFGEISYRFSGGLKASVGVRGSHSVVKDQQQIIAGPLTGRAYSEVNLPDQSEDPVTPRATLSYEYSDQHMVYGTVAKGYRSGGANSGRASAPTCLTSLAELGLSAAPDSFESDSLWSYELGSKDTFFDGRVAVQSSVYYIDWTNLQSTISLPSCGQNYTGNRGKAVVKGAELQFEAVPLDGARVGANVGYADAYAPESLYGASVNGVPPLLVGAGDKLGVVLPWTASAYAEYAWSADALWSGARSFARLDYRWQDSVPAANPRVTSFNQYQNAFRDEAYGTLSVRFGITRDGLQISAFMDNVTNEDPRLSFSNLSQRAATYPLAYQVAIRPRTGGLALSYGF